MTKPTIPQEVLEQMSKEQAAEAQSVWYFNFALMTQSSAAIPQVHAIHHRMPVMLDADSIVKWLDCESFSFRECEQAIARCSLPSELEVLEVSDRVNSLKNDGPDNILAREEARQKSIDQGIGRFFKPVSKVTKDQQK